MMLSFGCLRFQGGIMRSAGRFRPRPVQRPARCGACVRWAHFAIIAILFCECLPITATAPLQRVAACSAVSRVPSLMSPTVSVGRLAGESLARLPLRFEALETGSTRRFLARTSDYSLQLTATEAALTLRTDARRLGRGADLGSPRNARSLQANKQLPGPRRDRAAPRGRPSANDQLLTATVHMRLIGANH